MWQDSVTTYKGFWSSLDPQNELVRGRLGGPIDLPKESVRRNFNRISRSKLSKNKSFGLLHQWIRLPEESYESDLSRSRSFGPLLLWIEHLKKSHGPDLDRKESFGPLLLWIEHLKESCESDLSKNGSFIPQLPWIGLPKDSIHRSSKERSNRTAKKGQSGLEVSRPGATEAIHLLRGKKCWRSVENSYFMKSP